MANLNRFSSIVDKNGNIRGTLSLVQLLMGQRFKQKLNQDGIAIATYSWPGTAPANMIPFKSIARHYYYFSQRHFPLFFVDTSASSEEPAELTETNEEDAEIAAIKLLKSKGYMVMGTSPRTKQAIEKAE